ncbi:amidohydrolase family protein [Tunturiibacter gelidoferens]|uniref:Putative TIM-barrel fold metal-dependent hydrolase n=1 Tax=Tunturiibacter lichenicola TaxID=2051959 RepID=A0A7Y9NS77_9BACT|nr:amidohydrolase [Edaphobacter lichenicola]NYF54023.1 putative TIM-barrel fold metal-dependent hydrolase [Edaphobacter lichenicola]
MMSEQNTQDKFIAMVSATADVTLPLSDFHPRCMLTTPRHQVLLPRFPVIDYHNHLDAQDPKHVLDIMDACGIEHIVNITMKVGEEAIRMIDRYRSADATRFSTIGWMDWTGVERDDFVSVSIDRLECLVEHGAIGFKFWKDLGLSVRDASGQLLHVDDERLAPIFDKAGQLGIPVMVHIGDPEAFFLPIDANNERYEELAAHPDWSFFGAEFSKHELLDQRDRVFKRHPGTTFVAAHIAENAEDLQRVSAMLDANPNVLVDISARASELGRQPYSARKFFLRFADRILFGADLVPEVEMYRLYYRFLETADEYFEYPTHASRQGRWNIYGMDLPADVLRKVYRDNALRLLPNLKSNWEQE